MLNKFLSVFLLTGITISASAAPIGWINPQLGQWSLGADVGVMTGRDFMRNGQAAVGEFESVYYTSRISYGLTDSIEMYGRLGAADLDKEANAMGVAGNIDGNSKVAWGGGVQGIFYTGGSWNLGADIQYFGHNDHNFPSLTVGADFYEWQAAVLAQGQFEEFFPYIGGKYSDARVKAANVNPTDDADDNFGVVAGAGFSLTPAVSGYVEGRFIDETAFGGGLKYTW